MRSRPTALLFSLLALLVMPHVWMATVVEGSSTNWRQAAWGSAGLAPDPAETPEPVVQVYAARTVGWRGVFAVHSWIALKREDAPAYERYDVVRWGMGGGRPSVRLNLRADPDGHWAGNAPVLLAELRGEGTARVIERLDAAIAAYPDANTYRTWPGPNSNSFVAYLAREVPELRVHLPPTAVGKDYLGGGRLFARTPSGTGYQVSLYGLAGISLGVIEGIELNLLGLTLGVDPLGLAVKLPGIGRLGLT